MALGACRQSAVDRGTCGTAESISGGSRWDLSCGSARVTHCPCRFTSFIATVASRTAKCWCDPVVGRGPPVRTAVRRSCPRSSQCLPPAWPRVEDRPRLAPWGAVVGAAAVAAPGVLIPISLYPARLVAAFLPGWLDSLTWRRGDERMALSILGSPPLRLCLLAWGGAAAVRLPQHSHGDGEAHADSQ